MLDVSVFLLNNPVTTLHQVRYRYFPFSQFHHMHPIQLISLVSNAFNHSNRYLSIPRHCSYFQSKLRALSILNIITTTHIYHAFLIALLRIVSHSQHVLSVHFQ